MRSDDNMGSTEMIDVAIPFDRKDGDILPLTVASIRRNVANVRTVFLIGATSPSLAGTTFVPETAFPFSSAEIARVLGTSGREGWYFQQLAKMHFQQVVPDALGNLLVVDADTVFLRPCKFVSEGVVRFAIGTEFHRPYFAHMQRLHPALKRQLPVSGIAHCMVFTRPWMTQLMHMVESSRGDTAPFWRHFIDAIDPDEAAQSGASEYETYFHYALRNFSDSAVPFPFLWRNSGLPADVLRYDCHYMSFHRRMRSASFDFAELQRNLQAIERARGAGRGGSRIAMRQLGWRLAARARALVRKV